jgi:hypothetical protein
MVNDVAATGRKVSDSQLCSQIPTLTDRII